MGGPCVTLTRQSQMTVGMMRIFTISMANLSVTFFIALSDLFLARRRLFWSGINADNFIVLFIYFLKKFIFVFHSSRSPFKSSTNRPLIVYNTLIGRPQSLWSSIARRYLSLSRSRSFFICLYRRFFR
jgi:hypothetical protein